MRDHLLRRHEPALDRVRWLFVLFNLLLAAMAPVEATYEMAPDGWRAVAMTVASMSFGLWAVLYHRAGGRGWWLELTPYLLLVAATVFAGDFTLVLGRWVIAMMLHALYRPGMRRTWTLAILHTTVANTVVVATGQPPENAGAAIVGAVSILVIIYLMQSVAATLVRHQELADRSAALARVSQRLLTERVLGRLGPVSVAGVRELVGPTAMVTAWRPRGGMLELLATDGAGAQPPDELALDDLLPEVRTAYLGEELIWLDEQDLARVPDIHDEAAPWRSAVVLPLGSGDGPRGMIVVADVQPLDRSLEEVLRSYIHQVALAEALTARERLLDGIVANSPDVILVVEADDTVTFASQALEEWVGRAPQDVVGQQLGELLQRPTTGRPIGGADLREDHVTASLVPAEGLGEREVELSARHLPDGSVVLNVRDVSERRRLEAEIAHRAFHDTVTGLANRARFLDRLERATADADRATPGVAVALLDLDDFKGVNDRLGHGAGDQVLVEVAERLEEVVGPGDLAARLGGDEFALLLTRVPDTHHAEVVATRVVDALREPVSIEGQLTRVSASIGLAMVDGLEPDEVLRNADAAMYAAKETGKNRFALFHREMREDLLAEQRLRRDLEVALSEDQLLVHYQPIVDLATGDPSGVEALVRWQHPTEGLLLPGSFIEIAERTGLIIDLGRWVLHRACHEVASWDVAPDAAPPTLSVNLSPLQVRDQELVRDVAAALRGSGLQPAQLTLEITETALFEDLDAAREVLEAVRQLGVRIAIDDFGAGYSSIAYLRSLPVDILKIDREFVAAIDAGTDRSGLAEAIVRLARTLQLHTVAEGVERPDQLDALHAWGCTHGQGWLWAAATDAEEVQRALGSAARPTGQGHAETLP